MNWTVLSSDCPSTPWPKSCHKRTPRWRAAHGNRALRPLFARDALSAAHMRQYRRIGSGQTLNARSRVSLPPRGRPRTKLLLSRPKSASTDVFPSGCENRHELSQRGSAFDGSPMASPARVILAASGRVAQVQGHLACLQVLAWQHSCTPATNQCLPTRLWPAARVPTPDRCWLCRRMGG
ncbi:MAG: hypothetical protein RLZZ436_3046 [Planctomycetota bacterium]